MKDGLEGWRQEIQALDREILRLTAQRMQLVSQIGTYKAQNRIAVQDQGVEQEKIQEIRSLAAELDLEPDFAEELMRLLMKHSIDEQQRISTLAKS